jgi:N-acyl amino acid synthase of PEP-CTERM/exosortase system
MNIVKECYDRFETRVTSDLNIKESGFLIKVLTDENEKEQAYRLRYNIFCKELKWVPETETSLEIDAFDDGAVFLGVLNEQNRLMAFIRIIRPENSFMLEEIFSFLVYPEHTIRKESDTVELSRFCLIPEVKNHMTSKNYNTTMLSMFLYKGVYQWCRLNGMRYLYFEVEYKLYELLCKLGFPCELIGPPNNMPDGVLATAIMLDWEKFEAISAESRPELLKWFSQGLSIPPVRRSQQPEFYLQHQVF